MIALSNQEKWRPWGAFALEAIVLVLEIWLFAPLQASLGRTGLILTELAFLALAVGAALLHKTSLKEVFPLKRPTLRELGGVLLLCLSGLMLSVFATHVSLILLPQSMPEIKELHDFLYTGQSLPVMVLIVAIMPAICEEALQRGAILSHLRSLKKDWLIILIMGIFFGLFHLSALRFLSTAILGALLSYLIVKKNNLILPMLMHLMNNLVSVMAGTMASENAGQALDTMQTITPLQRIGGSCIVCCLVPVLLVAAGSLIDPTGHRRKSWLVAGLCGVALFTVGMVCASLSM